MRKAKQWIVLMVMVLVLALPLSACSNSSKTGSSSSSNGKVTLTWWSHDNPTFVKANKKLIADYEKDHPNVKINYQIFPYDALVQKLKTAFAGGNPPDFAQVFGSWAPQYAKNNLLAEVPEDKSSWLKDNFYEPTLGAYTYKGHYYGIPHEYNLENGGILANPKMFKDAGLSYPTTWEDLVKDAEALTEKKGDKITRKGFEFLSGDNITFLFLSLILQQGGHYLTEDGHVNFTSPEAVKAMDEMKKFITDYKVTDFSDFTGELDISDHFFKGKSAMAFRGPWTIAVGKENYKVDNFDYIPMPSYTSNPPTFAAETGWGEIVAKKSHHQKEAWDFIEYMAQPEQAKYFNITTFTVPANKNVAEDPDFVAQLPKMKTSLDALQYGQFIGMMDTDYLKKQVNDHFELVAANKQPVDAALKEIETSVNNMIDKNYK